MQDIQPELKKLQKQHKDNKEQLIPREKYELLAHTSDEEHMVKPSVGKRKVLLLFI